MSWTTPLHKMPGPIVNEWWGCLISGVSCHTEFIEVCLLSVWAVFDKLKLT